MAENYIVKSNDVSEMIENLKSANIKLYEPPSYSEPEPAVESAVEPAVEPAPEATKEFVKRTPNAKNREKLLKNLQTQINTTKKRKIKKTFETPTSVEPEAEFVKRTPNAKNRSQLLNNLQTQINNTRKKKIKKTF